MPLVSRPAVDVVVPFAGSRAQSAEPRSSPAGGFREDIRAAEDADLSYRLRAAGWTIEGREPATVTHRI
jgi:hypothetical protein